MPSAEQYRDINKHVQSGLFRQDLLYRINLMELQLPLLRERLDDMPELVAGMLRTLGTSETRLPDTIMQLLKAYDWPGNLRELKNILERAVLLAQGASLKPEHFASVTMSPHSPFLSTSTTIHNSEHAHISAVWQQTGGDVAKATKLLGISRTTLYRKLKSSDLESGQM